MNITNNESEKMKIFRKQINKIMNLNMLKNFEKLPNIDTIISLYSSKKSYISPKIKKTIIYDRPLRYQSSYVLFRIRFLLCGAGFCSVGAASFCFTASKFGCSTLKAAFA